MFVPFLLSLALRFPAPWSQAQAPAKAPLEALERSFRENPLFARLQWECDATLTPFGLFVQRGESAPPESVQPVLAELGPWLARLGAIFQREFVEPLHWTRRLPATPVPVFLFENERTYKNALRWAATLGPLSDFACTLRVPEIAVGYRAGFAPGERKELRRTALLHEALLLLYQRHADPKVLPENAYFLQSLAGYLTAHEGDDPTRLEAHAPSSAALTLLREGMQPDDKSLGLLPIAELFFAPPDVELSAVFRKYGALNSKALSGAEAARLFHAELVLLQHYLQRGEGGRWREGTRRYVALVAKNLAGSTAFLECLGVPDYKLLDTGFEVHVRALLDPSQTPAVSAPQETEAARWIGLLVEPSDNSGRLALALGCAQAGQLARANELLAQAIASATAAEKPRLERELQRTSALESARTACLQALASSKSKLRLEWGGQRQSLSIERYADGRVYFAKNRAGLTELAEEEIPSSELAAHFRDPGAQLARAYARLLDGEADWNKGLGEDAGVQALVQDASSAFAEELASGQLALRLERLARAAAPADAAAAAVCLAEIQSLLQLAGAREPVASRRADLRAVASEALAVVFGERGGGSGLQGHLEELGEGRIRLTYEFDRPEELEDFRSLAGYLASFRNPAIRARAEADSEAVVRNGQLELRGMLCLRHVAELSAPCTLRYELVYGQGSGKAGANVLVGICDDGRESYIGAMDIFDLFAVNRESATSLSELFDGERALKAGESYKVQLSHDGRLVKLSVAGKRVGDIACASRTTGAILLWANAEVPVAIQSLVIEASLGIEQREQARQKWIEQELAALGL